LSLPIWLRTRPNEIIVNTAAFGRVSADKPRGYQAKGREATLGIRPERLRILWDDDKSDHEVKGTIIERHYFGEITHLVVEVPGLNAPLSVTETNNFGADDLPVGSPVRLAYDPDALVALAD
jgi:spermidine/putrescine transport system ATP-binding protein